MFFYKLGYVHDTKAAAQQPVNHQPAYQQPAIKGPPRPKPRPQQGRPFDPDDLTRRLYVVLAEQKALEERKRRVKAAAEAERQAKAAAVARDAERAKDHSQHGIPLRVRTQDTQQESMGHPREVGLSNGHSVEASPSAYRHIPQVAASQFARTTTAKTATETSLARRLSRQIQTVASTEADQKSLSSSLKSKASDQEALKHSRRKSTGAMLSRLVPAGFESAQRHSLIVLDKQTIYDHCEVAVNPDEHRVDWTQSDEEAANKQKSAAQTLLRKAESKWALRSRLGSLSKHGKSDKTPSPPEDKESSTGSPKSPKIVGLFNLTSDDYQDNIQGGVVSRGSGMWDVTSEG